MKHKIKEFAEWKAEVLELLESEWYMDGNSFDFDFEDLYTKEKKVGKAVLMVAYDEAVMKQQGKRLIVMDFRKGK